MPHFVAEYSRPLEANFDKDGLCDLLHQAAMDSGEFGLKDIKVRLIPVDDYRIAGQVADFLHVTIWLLDGRTNARKKEITQLVLDRLATLNLDLGSLSVDARDMYRDVYVKRVQS